VNHKEHYSKTPVGIFFGAAGHPIPYSTVFVTIVNVRTGAVVEYKLRANISYVSSRIRAWSE
jgi:hypothetical protein